MSFLSLFIEAGAVGIFLAAAFVIIAAASAFFAFVMLRKTVKMAFRMVIVAIIMLIGVVGIVSFLWFSSGSGEATKPRPANLRGR